MRTRDADLHGPVAQTSVLKGAPCPSPSPRDAALQRRFAAAEWVRVLVGNKQVAEE